MYRLRGVSPKKTGVDRVVVSVLEKPDCEIK